MKLKFKVIIRTGVTIDGKFFQWQSTGEAEKGAVEVLAGINHVEIISKEKPNV